MSYQPVTRTELLTKRTARRGVVAFMDVILFLFRGRGATNLGIYNRRSVRGGSGWSLHAVGRAADIGIPNKTLGDEIWLRLIRAATKIGAAEIIWWGQRWTAETGVRRYTGDDNHHTHIHVGFTREMADNPTPRDDLTKWIATAILNG